MARVSTSTRSTTSPSGRQLPLVGDGRRGDAPVRHGRRPGRQAVAGGDAHRRPRGLRRRSTPRALGPGSSSSSPPPHRLGRAAPPDGNRHAALLPFVDGRAGQFGHYDPGVRAAVVSMLADLHRADPAATGVLGVRLELAGRARLEAALRDVNETWSGGPTLPNRHDTRSRLTRTTWRRPARGGGLSRRIRRTAPPTVGDHAWRAARRERDAHRCGTRPPRLGRGRVGSARA